MFDKSSRIGKVLQSGLVIAITLALLVATATLALPARGSDIREIATDESYDGVTAVDSNNIWAVGTNGTIVHYDGLNWTDQESGTTQDLTGVDAVNENNVWAVGTNGTILYYDGTSWTSQNSGTNDVLTDVSAVDTDHVWAVGTQGTILFFNGSTWTQQGSGTNKDIYGVYSLDANHVWAVGADGIILFFNGLTWTQQASGTTTDLFGVCGVDANHVWAVGAGGKIIFFDGSVWTTQASGTNKDLYSVSAVGVNDAWASGADGTLLHYDGETWSPHDSGTDENLYDVVPVNDNEIIAVGDNETVVHMEDPDPETWYLAEGTTAWGFSCYVTIENPNSIAVTAQIGYMTGEGLVDGGEVNLPAASQATVNPRDTLGDKDFSTKVECKEGKTIAVDRTMTWAPSGAGSGVAGDGHCSIGVTSPAKTWYLAEGSSAWGFECWLLIQNPNNAEATAQVTYMIEGAGSQTFEKKIPANSRETYSMADDIGAKDASIKVEADMPVIPERAMYKNSKQMGHDSIGTTSPAASYYLAEGTTAWGFTTYVLVQNPQATATDVTITYMTTSGPVPQAPFNMPGNSRKTIRVNDVMPDTDFSTQVTGSQAIIAERAMYWGEGTEKGGACHDSIGLAAPHTTFYLPDGETSNGRETWTLVMNPNAGDITVEVSYLTSDGAGNEVFEETIAGNSRKTFSMVDEGISGRAAVMVTSKTAGKKIMVERAMYWDGKGAGTDTIGGYTD
ncbi:MAG: hypothetical protein KKB90_04260 [Actinobacteria bacterium]|nr:hypothetical protein [Actinomycetota bacterium]MCG2818651.1 hypothetical protein [Actinomycetes bacterium]MBU4218160.1 hypothetical protein [Actinomycetota bacterium]MBU4358585.1 hypothetical protein [Actinomycetota bacterium]MBU4392100.1 hypothetical protein [Actinomycetota bacterium]